MSSEAVILALIDIVKITLPLAALCYGAGAISIRAVTKMFFPESIPTAQTVRRPRWGIFRVMNWIIGVAFAISFSYAFSTSISSSSSSAAEKRLNKFAVMVSCLCLTYLLGFFGVTLSYENVEEAANASESRTENSTAVQQPTATTSATTHTCDSHNSPSRVPDSFPNCLSSSLQHTHDSCAATSLSSSSAAATTTKATACSNSPTHATRARKHVQVEFDSSEANNDSKNEVKDSSPTSSTSSTSPSSSLPSSPSSSSFHVNKSKPIDTTTIQVQREVIDQDNWKFLFSLSIACPFLVMLAQAFLLDRARVLANTLFLSASSLPDLLSNFENYYSLSLFIAGAMCYKMLFQAKAAMNKHEVGVFRSEADDLRRAATYPPPFPNGWYKLADSWEVERGGVMYVKALGQDFVVFRSNDEKGEVSILDAYCPHMGANLAVGGTVKGDCITCPFHKWEFRGSDGQATHIPYAYHDKNIPESARVKAWPTLEFHNVIAVYYDAEGRSPPYYPPLVPEILDGRFVYRGKYDADDVHMHIQEFAENSADFQHFDPLHGQLRAPYTSIPIPGFTIVHKADWIPQTTAETKHIAYFKDHAYLRFMGRDIPNSSADATITFIGPAGLVYFRFELKGLGDILLVQSHLPIKPMLQKTQFRWYADRSIPRFLVAYVVGNWIAQWKNDIMVWENKVFCAKPYLVKGDGPVSALRRWYKQFYSESSELAKKKFVDMSW